MKFMLSLKARKSLFLTLFLSLLFSCGQQPMESKTGNSSQQSLQTFTPVDGKVKLMVLAPGHFHASLVQKTMYDQVDSVVHVYAPEGSEVENYLKSIENYNNREENPTAWVEEVYTGSDYLEKMLEEHPGNVMVVSGNNAKKTEYILRAVEQGIYVLADKPMVITPEEFPKLEKAFEVADEEGVLLYDIMTERYEITTLLQKELSLIEEVFGTLQAGSTDQPSITKESVHHFSKLVSGEPLIRPAWFFDTEQQGEGVVDISTHLVDLIQWEAFPGVVLSKEDVEIQSARRWSTDLTPEMFRKVTGLDEYPEYLQKNLDGELLKVYSNGEINYTLKDIHAKVSVIWNFKAPEGTGDTHYSLMRGSGCDLVIRQGEDEGYSPVLYIEPAEDTDLSEFEEALGKAVNENLAVRYPGVALKKLSDEQWSLVIPEEYKVGHEAHFAQVMEKYLGFLKTGSLPEWEIPNMIVKYYTTTQGMKKAME